MTILLAVLAPVLAAALLALAARLRTVHGRMARLRERIEALEDDARRTEEAKTRFLMSITHELRTPLTAILGYQELLADGLYGTIDPRCQEPVARIGDAAEQLLRLIDGVLELARLDIGRLELHLGRVALDELLARAADHARALAADQGVALETDIPAGLPTIVTDPNRLAHAVELSIAEAIRASAGTTLRLGARLQPDRTITLEIAGTGLALDAHSPERIFAEFGDMPDAGERSSQTGLRLSVAFRLARLLGGDLALVPDGGRATLRLRIAELHARPD